MSRRAVRPLLAAAVAAVAAVLALWVSMPSHADEVPPTPTVSVSVPADPGGTHASAPPIKACVECVNTPEKDL